MRPHEGRPYLLGSVHPATEEILELAATLGLRLVAEVHQGRDRPHPGTFFGKGKLAGLREAVEGLRSGDRPDGWRWAGDRFVIAAEGGDETRTAWAGTRWARAHAAEEGGPGEERAGDPLVSHAKDPTAGGTGSVGADEDLSRGVPPASRRTTGGAGGGRLPPDLSGAEGERLLLVLNEDVRPAVLFNLEERLGVEVWDRTRLILEIFSQHAHVKEARLQVELAMLQYEIPLIHEAVHRRRSGERPGFMSGGEYEVADYEDFIKRRMRTVKEDLERIRREREVRRKVRRERFYLVSLAGYTNAGKSSLMNALTGATVHEKWEMFSTLETTTRKMPEQGAGRKETGDGGRDGAVALNMYNRPILLTDTVGFIQALPSWLLDAFRSTLEEISVSDVVLFVADVSDPVDVLLEKVRVCRQELAFLDVTCPVLLVLNKCDLVPPEAVSLKRWRLVNAGLAREDAVVQVSSKTFENIGALVDAIDRALPALIRYEAEVPSGEAGQRFLSLLYGWGEVQHVDYGERTVVQGLADPIHWKTLVREALQSGVEISRSS